MASLVTEALASAGTLAKDDWNTKISKLSARSFDVKRDLNDFIQQHYVDFVPLLLTSDQINSNLNAIKDDVENLQRLFETMVESQIQDSTKEFEELSLQHSKTTKLVEVLEKLQSIHLYFEGCHGNLKSKNFYQVAISLSKIDAMLKSLEGNVLVETNIYKALKTEFLIKREHLQYSMDEAWRDAITWTLPTSDEDVSPELTINFSVQANSVDGQDLVFGLFALGNLNYKLQKFSKTFMEHFLKPLVQNKTLYPVIKKGSYSTLILDTVENVDLADHLMAPDTVFKKVQSSLEFLHSHLLNLAVSPDQENQETLIDHFRLLICEEMFQILIDQCLKKSVPNTKEELKKYKSVEEAVKQFEESLKKINFLRSVSEEPTDLMTFVSDIHVHFANQRCRAILTKARSFMKMDIYETIRIDGRTFDNLQASLFENLKSGNGNEKNDLALEAMTAILKPSKSIHENTLCLPTFRISKGAKDIVDLAYNTLHEASLSTSECALRLMVTTEDIFELYAAIVPTYHKESLMTLPQVAALHHNDCWYIAHHLLTMGHQFSKHLPANDTGVKLSFSNQVPMIRQLGSECFLQQMRRARDQMLDCLVPLKTFVSNPQCDKYTTAEKPIKQVLHQLHHLRKVWLDVLPFNILQTATATLVDSVISEVVSSICKMQDISSDDSVQLSMLCRLLQDEIPSLFDHNAEESIDDVKTRYYAWQREVRKWPRLSELIVILGASLREIVDRWASGKGPLTESFTVIEVKGLIRALFQNTERRANAISKIRY